MVERCRRVHVRKGDGVHAQALIFAFALPVARPFVPAADIRPPARLSRGKSDLFLVGTDGRTADVDPARPSSRYLDLEPRNTLQQEEKPVVEPLDVVLYPCGSLGVSEWKADRGGMPFLQEKLD